MSFLNNMLIRNKVMLIMATFTVPIGLLTYQLYTKLEESVFLTRAELQGSAYARPLLKIMNKVADYRVDSVLRKDGDKTAEEKLKSEQEEVESALKELSELELKFATQLKIDKSEINASTLSKRWEAAKANPLSYEVYDSLLKDDHTLLNYIAEKSNLILDPDLDTYYIQYSFTTEAPNLLYQLSNVRYSVFLHLHNAEHTISKEDLAGLSQIYSLIKNVYYPKFSERISAGIAADDSGEVVSPTLKKTITPKLDEYNKSMDQFMKLLEGLIAGGSMLPAEYLAVADPLHDLSTDIAVLTSSELDKMLEMRISVINDSVFFLLGICIVIVGLAFVFALYVAASISSPINKLKEIMVQIKDGQLDVVVPSQQYKDEIAAMANCVESFRLNGIAKIKLEAENIEKDKLAKEEKIKATNELAMRFETRVNGIIQAVASAATELYHSAESMDNLMKISGTKVENVKSNYEITSSNINTVASSAEEMSSSINEINEQVTKSSASVRSSVVEVDKTDKTSSQLQESALKIGKVVELIQDISEQINLLALNATIEAARAGEAGKGFAVVASEVKSLAGQTTKATEEIAQYVSSIQNVSNQVLGGLKLIKKSITDAEQYSVAIAATIEEQSAATGEIAGNISSAAKASASISKDINDVRQSSLEASNSATEVLNAAAMLSRESEKLNQEVGVFLSEVRA
jgi:hypothetical protein